jgi:hypothetical protein
MLLVLRLMGRTQRNLLRAVLVMRLSYYVLDRPPESLSQGRSKGTW